MTEKYTAALSTLGALAIAAATGANAQTAERAPQWGGFYVGLNVGADQSLQGREIPFTSTLLPGFIAQLGTSGTSTVSTDRTAFFYGGQVGYNHQVGASVIGIEMDFQNFAKPETENATNKTLPHPVAGTISTDFTAAQGTHWVGTVRGRLGYALTPSLLVYATGGLAIGEIFYRAGFVQNLNAFPATTPGLASMSNSTIRVGSALGAGTELKLSSQWSTKLEFIQYDLGTLEAQSRFVYPNVATTVGSTATSASFRDRIFRLGLNYRLN